ncbi:MAG: IS630 family transposase [Microthrixaceae bacterium]|nr:IS630 family transposase [Acidimicrobiales bacterium]MCB1258300.1 IS630 family transposase [Microthrixaceae bacterium]
MPVVVAPLLKVSRKQRVELERMARSSSLPHRCVVQASALLLAADGEANEAIARACSTTPDTVRRWRRKFEAGGVEAVGTIAAGRGRKPEIAQAVIDAIVEDTLHTVPDDGSTQWSTRTMAARHGVGKDTVARIWRARKLRPWRVETFKLSNDSRFEEKLVDVVGLYLNPPERAVVFSFDEKTQCQALDRTQPSLPLKAGRARTMTHDYKRNGTTDLFAALNVGTGEVLHQTRKSHKGADVLAFFKWIDVHTPQDLEIHVVLDNLSAHKGPEVREWLAHPKRKRWHLHFTPTSSSWLNLVEGWFAQLTNKRLRTGSFNSVAALEEAIDTWVSHWNDDPKPFIWTKNANDIIAKVKRGRVALTTQIKSATDH